MRSTFLGLMAVGLFCSVTWAQNNQPQNPQRGNQVIQPANPGQRDQAQPGQQGQLRQGQAGQQGQPGQPSQLRQGQAGQQGLPGQQSQAASADQQIAACISGECHNEVEISKFAQSRLQTPECKKFAEMMVKAHTPECEAYQKLAGNLATMSQRGSAGRADAQRAGGQQSTGGPLDWVSIHQEVGQKCLQTTQQELSKKEGADFDKCYMTQQVMCHLELKDKLTVLSEHASPQLAKQIDASLEDVNTHLKEAQQIMEKMKDSPSERVSRKPEGNK